VVGGSRVLRADKADRVTLIAAGITVHEALAAAEELEAEGIPARVLDAYSIKPIDGDAIVRAARETGRLVTVEDHWPEGGLGEAVRAVFSGDRTGPPIVSLAVRQMPASASPQEQLRAAGVDRSAIADAARRLVSPADQADFVGMDR
jgi:transketolase